MCEAIQTIADRAAEKATNTTRISTLLGNVQRLMEKMNLSAEQSMNILDVSESDRKELLQLL